MVEGPIPELADRLRRPRILPVFRKPGKSESHTACGVA